MMRDIKFRAWNGHAMELDVIVGNIGAFYHSGLDPDDSASLSSGNTIYGNLTPIMQYTGLKDKNGVEIYEGDILQGDFVVPEEHLTLNMTVLHITGCFCIKDKFGSTNPLYEDNEVLEIVGNVHENPELWEKLI